MKSLDSYWYKSNPVAWFLLPLSVLYCMVITLRRCLYKLNFKKSYTFNVPVIIVGNIVAGGSGKTPLLISLCEYARNNGLTPGIVSRGYGGSFTGLRQVLSTDTASLVGDEPLMIHHKTKAPVVVGSDRVAAINLLLENNKCDVVFSDDGLQHYRMQRNFEIAVVDSSRRFGNGFCLPAGPLREPVSRLSEVDLIVYNATEGNHSEKISYSLQFSSVSPLNGGDVKPLAFFNSRKIHVHAVAGIGNPARFFNQLRQKGLEVIEHAFPDHHQYVPDDFLNWSNGCIIMTEKDAIKCASIHLADAWVVKTTVLFSSELESKLDEILLPIMNESKRHEKKT